MTTEIDVRDWPAGERRERLIDLLAGAEPDEEFEIVSDRDLDPHLVRFQIDHDRSLQWEYDDPDAEPRELRLTVGDSLNGALGTIDVRDLKPQRRHEALLGIFDELETDEGFVLVNDHDPKPLYHELRSMHGDVVDWGYASEGGGEWRVEIRKTGDSEATDDDVVTRYDVRDIPKAERHPTIHHRYGMIPDGGTMELIAPHEPKPLKREFHGRYGDAFTWEVVESEPGRCRVRITKQADVSGDEPSSDGDEESSAGDDGLAITEELDVRDLPPAQRHEKIFAAYDELTGGHGFVLVNDHDPKPLYHQFEAEAGPEFHWEYRAKDPGEFRVVIGKTEASAGGSTADASGADSSTAGETEPPF